MTLADKINKLEEEKTDNQAWAKVDADGGELSTGVLSTPITDNWDSVLIGFGLDPTVFEIVDDTVRISKWQSSKRLENGDRDVIWLYSYRAKFRRKNITDLPATDFEEYRKRIAKWKPKKVVKKMDGEPCTFVVNWADWQLYKSAGNGIEGALERITDSFEKTVQRIKDLKKLGRNIEQIAIVNMGDPIEGCDGFYPSQLFTVKGTQRQQLLTALDLWVVGIGNIAPLAEKAKFISTLSNHGEWTRRAGKSVTSDSDSADGFLADTLERILIGSDLIQDFHIPHDEMITQVNLSGIEVAFTHGHKISGKELEWLRGQSLRLLRDHGSEPNIWITAHKHHYRADDFGPWYRFQCPSLDGGSKWYEDMSGNWSTAGTLTMLVGCHDVRGFSDVEIL